MPKTLSEIVSSAVTGNHATDNAPQLVVESNTQIDKLDEASALTTFNENLDASLKQDKFDYTSESGKIAATRALTAALDVQAMHDGRNLKGTSLQAMNHGNSVHQQGEVTIESFTNRLPEELAAVSYKYNLFATRQDAFSEAVFPIYVGRAGAVGVEIDVEVDYLYQPFARKDGGKFKKDILAKVYADVEGPFAENTMALKPVSNAANDKYLVKAPAALVEDVKDTNGKIYKTAPLAFGKEIPLVEIGRSPAILEKGLPQESTQLDPNITVTKLILDIGGTATKLDISRLAGATFTYSQQGDDTDISLTAVIPDLKIKFSNLIDVDPAGAAPIAGVGAVAAGHYGSYKLSLHGDGNIEAGVFTVFASGLELIELRTLAGVLETDAAAIAEAESLKLAAFEVDARITNEDVNTLGLIIDSTVVTQNYPIKPMAARSVKAPIKGLANALRADDKFVTKLIKITYYDMNLEAANSLVGIANFMRNNYSAETGMSDRGFGGIGKDFVNPYFESINLDLTTAVDSQRSGQKGEDIGGAISVVIKQLVNRMVTNSNYGNAKNIVEGTSQTIDVVIATNSDIESWIPSNIDLGAGKRVKIVSRRDKGNGMAGKIYVMFGNFDNKADRIDPLAFGNTLWVPTLIGEGERTIGSSTTRVLVANPTFSCQSNTHILGEINVTGLDVVARNKIVQNRKTV